MEDLIKITTMSSREIAELTGKNHQHVLRDCDVLNESYDKLSLSKIGQSSYVAENGQTYREYLLTRMQCFDLMTGYNTELRIKVNRRWEELETRPKIDFSNPDTVLMLAQNWKEERTKRLEAEKQIVEKTLQLDESKEWYSIKRYAIENGLNWRYLSWRALKAISYELGYTVKKIFDANYGQVNIYHIEAFRAYLNKSKILKVS